MLKFLWRSQGEAEPPREAKSPGSQRSQPLSSPELRVDRVDKFDKVDRLM